jgi:serine/threonine protein kinase
MGGENEGEIGVDEVVGNGGNVSWALLPAFNDLDLCAESAPCQANYVMTVDTTKRFEVESALTWFGLPTSAVTAHYCTCRPAGICEGSSKDDRQYTPYECVLTTHSGDLAADDEMCQDQALNAHNPSLTLFLELPTLECSTTPSFAGFGSKYALEQTCTTKAEQFAGTASIKDVLALCIVLDHGDERQRRAVETRTIVVLFVESRDQANQLENVIKTGNFTVADPTTSKLFPVAYDPDITYAKYRASLSSSSVSSTAAPDASSSEDGQMAAKGAGTTMGVMIGSIVGGLVLIGLIVLVAWNLTSDETGRISGVAPSEVFPFPPIDQFELPREHVELGRKLGNGAFGVVVLGKYTDHKGVHHPVAVKQCQANATVDMKKAFLKEADVMKPFRRTPHPNILGFVGICFQAEPLLLVVELMHTDLLQALRDSECVLDLVTKLRLSRDVANAVSYLANMKFVHRDLACRNCLVDVRLDTVKIADFGLSKDVVMDDYYTLQSKTVLPVRWMAPESLTRGNFSKATDVWSLAVVFFEIFSQGERPYASLGNGEVLDFIKGGGKLGQADDCPMEVYATMTSCWAVDPKARPTAAEVYGQLCTYYVQHGGGRTMPSSMLPPVIAAGSHLTTKAPGRVPTGVQPTLLATKGPNRMPTGAPPTAPRGGGKIGSGPSGLLKKTSMVTPVLIPLKVQQTSLTAKSAADDANDSQYMTLSQGATTGAGAGGVVDPPPLYATIGPAGAVNVHSAPVFIKDGAVQM